MTTLPAPGSRITKRSPSRPRARAPLRRPAADDPSSDRAYAEAAADIVRLMHEREDLRAPVAPGVKTIGPEVVPPSGAKWPSGSRTSSCGGRGWGPRRPSARGVAECARIAAPSSDGISRTWPKKSPASSACTSAVGSGRRRRKGAIMSPVERTASSRAAWASSATHGERGPHHPGELRRADYDCRTITSRSGPGRRSKARSSRGRSRSAERSTVRPGPRALEGPSTATVRAHLTTAKILLADGAKCQGTIDPERTEAAMHVARFRRKQELGVRS